MARTIWTSRWLMAVFLLPFVASLVCTSSAYADPGAHSSLTAASGDVSRFKISPDGVYVVYLAKRDTDGPTELYSMPTGGGASIKLSGDLPSGFTVEDDIQISSDSRRVVYRLTRAVAGVKELYSVPLTGGGATLLAQANDVKEGFQISLDSGRVVYRAIRGAAGADELYSVPMSGPESAGVRLNGALAPGGSVLPGFRLSPDSSRVVYLAIQGTMGVTELYSVPMSGPESAGVKLNGALAPGGSVTAFQISPDASRVVYRADQQTDGVDELYSVPIEGPDSAGVKLNGTFVSGENVFDFQISPDSSRVVYRAFRLAEQSSKLYSVLIAGAAGGPTELIRFIAEGGSIAPDFQISSDSRRVVYRADKLRQNVIELYSVPVEGPSTAWVRLNNDLVVGGSIGPGFQISPDSRRVVYLGAQEAPGLIELYSVPTDGATNGRIKLSGTLRPGRAITSFQISPRNDRVVYLANQRVNNLFDLYSAPLGGGSPAGKINANMILGGNVRAFQVYQAGVEAGVIYLAERRSGNSYDILQARIVPPPAGANDWRTFLPLARRR